MSCGSNRSYKNFRKNNIKLMEEGLRGLVHRIKYLDITEPSTVRTSLDVMRNCVFTWFSCEIAYLVG